MVVPSSTSSCSNSRMWRKRLRGLVVVDPAVDPDDEHVLVVAAVEHDELAVARDMGMDPPQVVVGQLGLGRLLEAGASGRRWGRPRGRRGGWCRPCRRCPWPGARAAPGACLRRTGRPGARPGGAGVSANTGERRLLVAVEPRRRPGVDRREVDSVAPGSRAVESWSTSVNLRELPRGGRRVGDSASADGGDQRRRPRRLRRRPGRAVGGSTTSSRRRRPRRTTIGTSATRPSPAT